MTNIPADAWATIIAAVIGVGGTIAVAILSRARQASNNNPPKPAEAAAALPTPPATGSHVEQVMARGVLRCGCIKHPPLADFNYVNRRWEFGGLYVELARKACEALGVDAEFYPVDWTELPASFTERDLDLVLSVFETRQRLAYADFVAPFHRIGVGAVALASSTKVRTVGDLQDDDVRIVVSAGEIGWECAVFDLKIPKRRLISIDNAHLPEIVDYVRTGRADIAIFDDVSCHACVSGDPDLVHLFAGDPLYLCKNSIMVRKNDPEFGRWLERVFLAARSDPDIVSLEDEVVGSSNGLIRRFR